MLPHTAASASTAASTSAAASAADPLGAIVGRSPAIRQLFDLIRQVAPTHLAVLITGETGTGKELVARAVHRLSHRANQPFIVINGSAIPESLFESELFGYVRGSFTGAVGSRRGLIEEANGGSLFIDEVSTLTPAMQVKLLRVLQDRSIRRVGSNQSVPVDFRLIAATNEDLAGKVRSGQFREDLYYRLSVFPLDVPPLRDRREDIPLLAEHFRRAFAHQSGMVPPPFSREMLDHLTMLNWPGNVRELEHFVQRAIVLRLGAPDVRCVGPLSCSPSSSDVLPRAVEEAWTLDRLEREYMEVILHRTHGHRGRAAAILGIDRRTLLRKLGAADGPDTPAVPIRHPNECRAAQPSGWPELQEDL